MTAAHVTVNGRIAIRAKIYVPGIGPWFADVELVEETALPTTKVTLKVGEASFIATPAPSRIGTFGGSFSARLVAGAGGWSSLVKAKDYHNDAGVKAITVARDVASAVGETLGTFVGGSERLGKDYARHVGLASRVIEDAARDAAWWVDYSGVTHVGTRPAVTAKAADYDVLDFDPLQRNVTLAVDRVDAIGIGSILSERLAEPTTIRALEIDCSKEGIRLRASCGDGRQTDLADTLRAVVGRLTDRKLHGIYRYRVLSMQGDRANLQVVKKAGGNPDLVAVSLFPGIPGLDTILTPGAEVLVQFIEGDRGQPVITHFAGKDGIGHVPIEIALCGGSAPVARVGDTITVFLPATAAFAGTVGGSPATGVITFAPPLSTVGIIQSGATKVKA
jgi:hypothetical protein